MAWRKIVAASSIIKYNSAYRISEKHRQRKRNSGSKMKWHQAGMAARNQWQKAKIISGVA